MKKIHFIAVGGSVMHQLAIALSLKGYRVTGSDDEVYEPARTNLKRQNLLPAAPGWDPGRITPDLDAVILGMHARGDNPEVQAAVSRHIPIFSFPGFIYQESLDKTRIVVGGSHGKTTITAMILHVLRRTGRDFDYLVGASLPGFEHSVRITGAPLIICEGDEYPASTLEKIPKFLFYHPRIAVLSGIAWDHINVFPTFDIYLAQFARFISDMEAGGTLIYNREDPELDRLVDHCGGHLNLIPYGTPDYRIRDGVTTLLLDGHETDLAVFGVHNLQNVMAAGLVTAQIGVPEPEFLEAISSFQGASRRLERAFEKPGALLFRDFAHAPSKVRASIQAVREQFPERQLCAIVELHTFSSLNADFLTEYAHAMDQADTAAVFYSSHALNIKRLPPLNPQMIREGFARQNLEVIDNVADLKVFLNRQPADETNLLMMSSGNFENLPVEEMIRLWQKRHDSGAFPNF